MIYEGNKWFLKEQMTCNARQGFLEGPLVWNVIYDDFLRIYLPVGRSIFGFTDNVLVVCAAEDVGNQGLRINQSLWRVNRWLDSRSLEMSLEKTEALLLTDQRSFKYLNIILGEHEIAWSRSIKYLGVQLGQRLSFSE